MGPPKASATKENFQNFKEEILHQFHVISEGVIDQVKQVAEGVVNVNEKLDRRVDELKAEIQETRQEILAAVKFSYAELDKRLQHLRRDSSNLNNALKK